MDHMEMVEALRAKTGLSYDEANAALERANWNLLDALIELEKEGKVLGSGHYTTSGKHEKTNKNAKEQDGESFSGLIKRLGKWLAKVLRASMQNQLCMITRSGEQVLSVPVLLVLILLLVGFWIIVPLMIVSLFFGCSYLFRGPDLGKDSINNVVSKATEAADSIKNEIRGEQK